MSTASCSFVGHPPTIVVSQRQRVPCPYCTTGGTLLDIEKGGGDKIRIESFRDPRKCDSCGKYFRLHIRVAVEGLKIDAE